MIGIGGVSMSGIAEILHYYGYTVTGSDTCQSDVTDKLISNGINVSIGHNTNIIKSADLVVYTADIKQDDPELVEAKKLNIPCLERAIFLGELTRMFKNTIGISGTHGKTTTTSMVSLCFIEGNLDPTIQVGAHLKQIDGNYRIGDSDFFVIEACEYVESFLSFSPKAEIILNIDNDHLDYFKNFDNIKNAFIKYVKLLPDDGLLVTNGDDNNCLELPTYTKAKCITYGINNTNCNFIAKNITLDNNGFPQFEVYKNNIFYNNFQLSVPGLHNVYNALACIALCDYYSISKDNIKNALLKFTGAHRRFEFVGKYNNISVFDDYAHHPTEILATAKAAKCKKCHESWVIFQPHTYSRTVSLLHDFANALTNFDNIIITDIYAAREINTYNISSLDLVNEIKKLGHDCIYIKDFDDIAKYVKTNAKPNDIILTVGAGNVIDIGKKIIQN